MQRIHAFTPLSCITLQTQQCTRKVPWPAKHAEAGRSALLPEMLAVLQAVLVLWMSPNLNRSAACGHIPRLLTNMRPRPVPTPNTVNSSQKLREAQHSRTVSAAGFTVPCTRASCPCAGPLHCTCRRGPRGSAPRTPRPSSGTRKASDPLLVKIAQQGAPAFQCTRQAAAQPAVHPGTSG